MKVMIRCVGILLSALTVVMSVEATAQIRVINRGQIDSIAKPQTVAGNAMAVENEGRISFGRIEEDGGVWSRSVKWQNRGDKPLVITRVTSSCSCLRVEADRKPVDGGEWGSVTLHYYPEKRGGEVSQRVLLYTNLSERQPTAVITVSGFVKPSADRRGDYPYVKGELLLRRDTIDIGRGEQVRVACMNGSQRALRLSHDKYLTEQGLTLRTEPQVLQAGEEGDMIISLSSAAAKRGVIRLVVDGLSVPPRQRTIVLRVKD